MVQVVRRQSDSPTKRSWYLDLFPCSTTLPLYILLGLMCWFVLRGPPSSLTPTELSIRMMSATTTTMSALSSTTTTTTTTNKPLSSFPSCSASQLDIIRHQLPPDECNSTKTMPWEQRCSYSYATRCPDALWLKEYYQQRYYQSNHDNNHKKSFVAMYIGCNKGMDAVNTLRMGSGNAAIDKNLWRSTFLGEKENRVKMHKGVCQQEFEEQFFIPPPSSSSNNNDRNMIHSNDAQVHCIEAMPSTARKLRDTAQTLGWESWFKVENLAMNDEDGVTLFPDHDNVVGIENKGIKSCYEVQNASHCKNVSTLRLDSYTQQHGLANAVIDVLSVDVEGFDWAVLSSGNDTLSRTQYLEFEYNWMGRWEKQSLRDSLEWLKEQGFICYWPGRSGHIWRLTDCWQDYYDLKFWSNVACVKADTQVELANRMEYMFLATLAQNQTIHYNHSG